jgi:hypothetical protein
MPQIGTCKLCRREAEIQWSHLIPRAIYLDLRMPELPNPHPIIGLPEETGPRQEQAVARLLCRSCEQRFSANGEKWILENGYRLKGPSRIFQALNTAKSVCQHSWTLYAGNEVDALDMDKITYFGASVFWRASAGSWEIAGKKRRLIDLGNRYQEDLRAFLAGEAAFPERMVLWSAVCRTADPPPVISFPTGEIVGEGFASYHRHTFDIPGLSYMLFVGNRIPDRVRELCIATSVRRFIFFSPVEEIIQRNAASVFAKSPPSPSLRKMHRKISGEELEVPWPRRPTSR